MNITPDLKLVLPLREDAKGDPVLYAYHHPISREVFDANYRIIAATQAALFSKGLAYAAKAGPRVAALRLADEARRDAVERGDMDGNGQYRDGGAQALLAEIKRLTMVLAPGAQGWDMLPVDAAIRAGHIDSEDWREAESAVVFFTVGFWMAKRSDRASMASGIAGVMGAQITSFNATDFIASLPTLMLAAHSETQKAGSSVPS
jgi:hypothetical protein